jgi:hypothetical protein
LVSAESKHQLLSCVSVPTWFWGFWLGQSSDHVDTPDMLEQTMYEDEPIVEPPFRVLLTNDDGGDSPFFVPWTAYVQEKLGYALEVLVWGPHKTSPCQTVCVC